MATIDALMGIGLGPDANQQALADSLRGQQRQGQFFGMSTLPGVAQYGQNLAKGAQTGAKQGGVLSQALAKEATRKTERQQDYERKVAAAKLKQEGVMDLQSAKGPTTQSYKPGTPELYENIKDPSNKVNMYFDSGPRKYKRVDTGEEVNMREWRIPGETEEFKFADIGNMDNERAQYDSLVELQEGFDVAFATAQDSKVPFKQTATVYLSRLFPAMFEKDGEIQAAGEWWRDLDKFYNLMERHDLFGGALTKGEARSWAQANVSPDNFTAWKFNIYNLVFNV